MKNGNGVIQPLMPVTVAERIEAALHRTPELRDEELTVIEGLERAARALFAPGFSPIVASRTRVVNVTEGEADS